jgi:hypothetical protein
MGSHPRLFCLAPLHRCRYPRLSRVAAAVWGSAPAAAKHRDANAEAGRRGWCLAAGLRRLFASPLSLVSNKRFGKSAGKSWPTFCSPLRWRYWLQPHDVDRRDDFEQTGPHAGDVEAVSLYRRTSCNAG